MPIVPLHCDPCCFPVPCNACTCNVEPIPLGQTTVYIPECLPECVSVDPAFGIPGGTLDVTITGENTKFDETSVVSFSCAYLTINSQTVSSPTEIVATITIAEEALSNICDVTVTTGSNSVTCAFEIFPDPWFPPVISPSEVKAGETIDITITLYNIDLTRKTITKDNINFGCTGVTVNSATVNSATTIKANISVAKDAPDCTGDVTIKDASDVGIVCKDAFKVVWVVWDNCMKMMVDPSVVRTGFFFPRTTNLTITSDYGCNFDDNTSVTISGGVKVLKTELMSATELKVTVQIPPVILGGKGSNTVTVQTGDIATAMTLTVQGLLF